VLHPCRSVNKPRVAERGKKTDIFNVCESFFEGRLVQHDLQPLSVMFDRRNLKEERGLQMSLKNGGKGKGGGDTNFKEKSLAWPELAQFVFMFCNELDLEETIYAPHRVEEGL